MMRQRDEDARPQQHPPTSRAGIGKLPGLGWVETFVLKAAGDAAMYLWECRLTLRDVEDRLTLRTHITRRQVEESLGPLGERGYLYADDAPENPEIVVHLTEQGLAAYCDRFVAGYGSARLEVLRLVCQDPGCDVHELVRRTGHPPMLVEHVLDEAQRMALLRVSKQGQYIRVTEVMPQLRWLVSGAA